MGYVINIEINGYEFQFGNMGYQMGGLGPFIRFDDQKVQDAIINDDPGFYSAIKELLNRRDELDALYTMTNFDIYNLQVHGWRFLTDNYPFNSLEDFKRKALIVLESEKANDDQLRTAKTIIDVLNGDYKFPPPPEKSPEKKANEVLSLKKNIKKNKNLFKPLQITEVGRRTIGIAQSNFENLWNQIDKIDASKYEKQECLDKLKEACCWLTRGIAKYHELKEEK